MSAVAGTLAAALDPVLFARGLGFVAEEWQENLLRTQAEQVLVVAARQVGKSSTVALKALHVATYEPGSLCLIFSPRQRQSDELLRKVRTYYRALTGHAGRPVRNDDVPVKNNESELELTNGSRIVSLPGSESGVRSFSAARLLILDEASRASDDLLAAVVPMVATGGQFMMMSTPWGRRGFFYELAELDQTDAWERHRTTVYESARWPEARRARVRASIGSFAWSSDYECVFGDTTSQLFSTEMVDRAFTSDVLPLEIP
ncbi:terminase large subunit domain-containing protein [Nakamurella leprariae]|uniref:Terminase n=1 Tax=Nakamurella leprariae TaxID=2803911 RepID=A0A939BXK9_9ACTN|nr:terminase family protein [Nakamurella leprariae]MBM9466090.1 hypothetical protein [Nakamurella leprariae]